MKQRGTDRGAPQAKLAFLRGSANHSRWRGRRAVGQCARRRSPRTAGPGRPGSKEGCGGDLGRPKQPAIGPAPPTLTSRPHSAIVRGRSAARWAWRFGPASPRWPARSSLPGHRLRRAPASERAIPRATSAKGSPHCCSARRPGVGVAVHGEQRTLPRSLRRGRPRAGRARAAVGGTPRGFQGQRLAAKECGRSAGGGGQGPGSGPWAALARDGPRRLTFVGCDECFELSI